jgi:hypothetical protein
MTDLPVNNQINNGNLAQPISNTNSDQTGASSKSNPSAQKPVNGPISVGGMSKEIGGGINVNFAELSRNAEVGKDIDLPKEVVAVGVQQTPSVVSIPPVLQTHGVQAAGQNVTLGNGSTVILPITDAEVKVGLKKSITDSWRWLAEWCIRKLKLS